MIRTTLITLTAAATAAAALSAPAHAQDMTIAETAMGSEDFTTLVEAVQTAGLVETLQGEGPFTVFAPTDDAFSGIAPSTLEDILGNQEMLTSILTYHVVPGEVMAADITDGMTVETVNGLELTFTVDGDTVMVDGATVVAPDIEASNGVIHGINAVLLPEM